MRRLFLLLILFVATLRLVAAAHAQDSINVRLTGVEPQRLLTTAGVRVDFINLTDHVVHVEFLDERHRHDIVQIPGTATIFAVFHREGRHPYEVHVVSGGREIVLRGVVDVAGDPARRPGLPECGITVMDICISR